MRSIILVLVGSVLIAGAAEAATCRLDGADLKAKSQADFPADVPRLDLVGRTFRIERVASRWRAPKVSEITVLIRVGEETFLVRQVADLSGRPVETGYSKPATERAVRAVTWSRAPDVERSRFSGAFDAIASGPLTYLDLTVDNCT